MDDRNTGIKKYYRLGETVVKALDGVDFAVREREFVAIIGKSGERKEHPAPHDRWS